MRFRTRSEAVRDGSGRSVTFRYGSGRSGMVRDGSGRAGTGRTNDVMAALSLLVRTTCEVMTLRPGWEMGVRYSTKIIYYQAALSLNECRFLLN